MLPATSRYPMSGHTAYSDEERNIVRAGIGAVRAVLFGADVEAVRRRLYCLDWFMGPYYRNDLGDMAEPLKKALQELTVATRAPMLPRRRCHCWNTRSRPTKFCGRALTRCCRSSDPMPAICSVWANSWRGLSIYGGIFYGYRQLRQRPLPLKAFALSTFSAADMLRLRLRCTPPDCHRLPFDSRRFHYRPSVFFANRLNTCCLLKPCPPRAYTAALLRATSRAVAPPPRLSLSLPRASAPTDAPLSWWRSCGSHARLCAQLLRSNCPTLFA